MGGEHHFDLIDLFINLKNSFLLTVFAITQSDLLDDY